jgi:triphosphoribosyl-dephospho-CoA synthase
VLEATARKPGNVHPGAKFADTSHADFIRSAAAVAPVLGSAAALGVGRAVLESIERTHATVGRNTNLGIVLLLAPLAAVPPGQTLRTGIGPLLGRLTQTDAALVYRAIRLAGAGGLGRAAEQDVSGEPTVALVDAMRLAARRDTIADQYATGFELVLDFGLPILEHRTDFRENWEEAIIELHLKLMVGRPDTLVARKCGVEVAGESARRAAAVLEAGWPHSRGGREQLRELDTWLRADGNRRNPGTTADVVTACLFAAFREGTLPPPVLESDHA